MLSEKTTMKKTLFLIFALASYALQSQTSIGMGTVHQLHSEVLGEDREIWVSVPEKAESNPELKFPVVYVLDGESYFHSFSGTLRHLSETNGNLVIPDMILVAITNTNRNRDFTPTVDSTAGVGQTGGASNFQVFLEKELIPFVEAEFPTASHRVLVGHSLGGLFAMHVFLKAPELFKNYIVLDPAMWWDDSQLLKETPQLVDEMPQHSNGIFLAIAHSLPKGMSTEMALFDTTYVSAGYRSIVELNLALQMGHDAFRRKSKYYPGESHGSIPLLGFYDGLRFLFDFYKRPSFTLITDDSPQVLESHYQRVSAKMGYEIPPPERTCVGLAWRCRALEHNLPRTKAFLEIAERYHPESIGLWYEWADYFQELGDEPNAKAALAKARDLENQAD